MCGSYLFSLRCICKHLSKKERLLRAQLTSAPTVMTDNLIMECSLTLA